MTEHEGVIQYRLDYTQAPPEHVDGLDELVAWRRMLGGLGLVGQDSARYGGLGFGNMSLRIAPPIPGMGQPAFVITGSQTGHLTVLGREHFATVIGWDIERNRVEARGPVRPSSESLTHAAIYAVDDDARCVMHVHSPEIWRHARQLALPTTSASATYGTPQMAEEVQRIVQSGPPERILVMQGHQDGVISWDVGVEAAGVLLLTMLARAFRLEVQPRRTVG